MYKNTYHKFHRKDNLTLKLIALLLAQIIKHSKDYYEQSHGPSNIPLAGWLFWYAGCTTECLICPITEYDIPFFGKQQPIKDKQGNLYMATTTKKDIISQHKACLRNRGHPKANFNRFANTVTYYD